MSGKQADGPGTSLRKILVVEDDAAYRRIVALQLGVAGCPCQTASTHAEALRLLDEDREIEVILLDYTMNGSGPDRLVEQLTSLRPEVRIVGHSSMNRHRDFAALGIREFVLKPLHVERFIHLLNSS